MIKALLVEDNPSDARLVQELLLEAGTVRFDLTTVSRLSEASDRLAEEHFDAVLLDLGLPDAFGLEGVTHVNDVAPEVPIVVLSGLHDENLAIQAVQRGAQDYLVKGQWDGRLLARVIRYAIERKRSEQYINHLAYHDGLTSLPNRRLLLDRLGQALARSRRNEQLLALIFLDLDRFKMINDMMGHAAGDQLLQQVAERLRVHTRASDTVARVGGDEFTLVLTDLSNLEDVIAYADKLIDALKAPFVLEGRELFVLASFGISLFPNDGDSAEILLKKADSAMYHAKQQGRNNYQFYLPAMNVRASERLLLGQGLRHAISRDEFVLYYQPLVDLRNGAVRGFEALIRWQHPERGLVPPGQFIPVAETTDMIAPIGEWVIRRAAAQGRAWETEGHEGMRISVNLSSRQLHHKGLLQTVMHALTEANLRPEKLELELTEGGIMRNDAETLRTLQKLQEAGVRLAIDDFGTGYSSLRRLKRFPIDTVKIDRGFIKSIPKDRDDAAIVTAIIAMAHGLDLDVVAEGVETEEQLGFLRDNRCDLAQGYYFSRPLPAAEIGAVLRDGGSWRRSWPGSA